MFGAVARWRSICSGLGVALGIAGSACDGGGGHGGGGGGFTGPECPEIFAYGFRNPWRMNFDPATGKLYVGDVGQSAQEEIDIVTSGGNYGWDCLEGELPHTTAASCSGVTFVPPEVVHGRSEAFAITGGAVYRGSAIPALQGFYVYGDFGTGFFFAFDADVPNAPSQRLTSLPETSVSAFGQGRDGEVYVVSFDSPSLQRIVGSGPVPGALVHESREARATPDDRHPLVRGGAGRPRKDFPQHGLGPTHGRGQRQCRHGFRERR
jgi:hypothetical protein